MTCWKKVKLKKNPTTHSLILRPQLYITLMVHITIFFFAKNHSFAKLPCGNAYFWIMQWNEYFRNKRFLILSVIWELRTVVRLYSDTRFICGWSALDSCECCCLIVMWLLSLCLQCEVKVAMSKEQYQQQQQWGGGRGGYVGRARGRGGAAPSKILHQK